MYRSEIKKKIKGKNILITGGTGSFGKQILIELLKYEPLKIIIFSRDEKKQYDLKQIYIDHLKKLFFILGDVRDFSKLKDATAEIDFIFHAAALKQVPSCELDPYEAVKTNIKGTENVRRAAIECGVDTVITISTDKAVKPVNVMGMTKAIQERIMLQRHHLELKTKFICVRYGNVLSSRGSVVPLFYNKIINNMPLPITDPNMTRFILTLSEAVQLVFYALLNGENGELWVKKMESTTVEDLANSLSSGMTKQKTYPRKVIGTRAGEKKHEVLISEEEMSRSIEYEEYFLIKNQLTMDHSLVIQSNQKKEYSSDSVPRISKDKLKNLLASEGYFEES